jgi:sugar transferase (PEP-CTERM/EpsH1 system associated)
MNILFLCHRIPFPPDKGEKIRAYHMLAHLAKEHTVHLGAFVDDPADMRHAETLRQVIGGECLLLPLGAIARVKMAVAFARGAPLSVSYFASGRLARWVDQILRRHNIDRAIVFSTAIAPYLLARRDFDPAHVIFDMVDVDSDKWRQYADAAEGLRAWIYRREMRTLLALERKAAFAFGATLLVSRHETETFRELAPEACGRLYSVPNGVDLEFFRPDGVYPNPFGANEMPIVMTGTMDYRPNTEGAIWFAQSVLPLIRAARPEARFYVVGARPSASVKSLAASNVVITGKVDDVRPYLAHAGVVVAPLKLSRGLQNKVLEGMAMSRPVIATSPAVQALNVSSGKELCIADDPASFAQTVIGALGEPAAIAANGRRYVEQNHDWTRNLAALDRLLDAGPRVRTSRAPVDGPVLPLARAAE